MPKKISQTFTVSEDDYFKADRNCLEFTLHGRPVPYKRVAICPRTNRRYSPNGPARASAIACLKELLQLHSKEMPNFKENELELEAVFFLRGKNPTSAPDLDNLAKFLMDTLQIAGVYQNDSQITRATIEKRANNSVQGCTIVKLRKKIVEIDV